MTLVATLDSQTTDSQELNKPTTTLQFDNPKLELGNNPTYDIAKLNTNIMKAIFFVGSNIPATDGPVDITIKRKTFNVGNLPKETTIKAELVNNEIISRLPSEIGKYGTFDITIERDGKILDEQEIITKAPLTQKLQVTMEPNRRI